MKKNIIVYVITCIALISARILVYGFAKDLLYGITGGTNLVAFVMINLMLPSLIIMIANGVINYSTGSSIKKCLLHAVILAMLSLVVNLGATALVGNQVVDMVESEETGYDESVNQELLDELDKQARQKMIDEGLISEDDEIYSEPFVNSGETGESVVSDGGMTGTWDTQIEKENPLSTITGAFLDVLLAFVSGMISVKIRKKKEERN